MLTQWGYHALDHCPGARHELAARPRPLVRQGGGDLIETVIVPRARDLGGFEVRRALPSAQRQMVGPFIFFDQMGPAEFLLGQGLDVRPHPHIGLATVTYLFDGEILHRDSLGTLQPIRPGDVNWMTAGRGIAHSERTARGARARAGGCSASSPGWRCRPRPRRRAPAFAHHGRDALPVVDGRGQGSAAHRRLALRRALAGADALRHVLRRRGARAQAPSCRCPPSTRSAAVYVAGGRGRGRGRPVRGRPAPGVPAGRRDHAGRGRARPPAAARRRADGRTAAHLVELRVEPHRTASSRPRRTGSAGRFSAVPGESEFIPLPDR